MLSAWACSSALLGRLKYAIDKVTRSEGSKCAVGGRTRSCEEPRRARARSGSGARVPRVQSQLRNYVVGGQINYLHAGTCDPVLTIDRVHDVIERHAVLRRRSSCRLSSKALLDLLPSNTRTRRNQRSHVSVALAICRVDDVDKSVARAVRNEACDLATPTDPLGSLSLKSEKRLDVFVSCAFSNHRRARPHRVSVVANRWARTQLKYQDAFDVLYNL